MKIVAWVKKLWKQHGTKVLGYLTGIVGAWQTAILAHFVDAGNTEKRIIAFLVIVLGTMTVQRGHTNTANAPPPPAPPTDKESPHVG